MKAKLVLLNGPCGIGKSTLAGRYIDEHPLALKLDMDDVWAMMGRWRDHAEASKVQKLRLAHAMAEVHLAQGYDVVVPNILKAGDLRRFDEIARGCGGVVCEFMLLVDKEDAIARFVRRGQDEGYESGFRPGGTLERSGGVDKLAEMYDDLLVTLRDRPNAIVIEPAYGDIESTYRQVITVTDRHNT